MPTPIRGRIAGKWELVRTQFAQCSANEHAAAENERTRDLQRQRARGQFLCRPHADKSRPYATKLLVVHSAKTRSNTYIDVSTYNGENLLVIGSPHCMESLSDWFVLRRSLCDEKCPSSKRSFSVITRWHARAKRISISTVGNILRTGKLFWLYLTLWGMLYGETFYCDSGGHVTTLCWSSETFLRLRAHIAGVYCVHVTYSASIRVFRLMSLFKFGERAFSHAEPAAWKSLPPDIRVVAVASPSVFKELLKTHFLT